MAKQKTPPTTAPVMYQFKGAKSIYPFRVEIRRSGDMQFYNALVSTNGEDVYLGETKPEKRNIFRVVNKWFPGVIITDKTVLKSGSKKKSI